MMILAPENSKAFGLACEIEKVKTEYEDAAHIGAHEKAKAAALKENKLREELAKIKDAKILLEKT